MWSSCGAEGLRLRWLHFDPGEEGKLRSLLESYARAQNVKGGAGDQRASGAGSSSGKSSTKENVPTVPRWRHQTCRQAGRTESGDAAPPAELPGGNTTGTRRLVRPSATAITPFSDAAPASGESGRIGTRRVVRPSHQAMTPFADAGKPKSGPAPPSPSGK